METSETQRAPEPQDEELRETCASLQRQVTWLLLALLIVSGTLTVFLWRQARIARKDLDSNKRLASIVFQAYQRDKPKLDGILEKVAEYGRSHPDFAPILEKYKINPTNTPATSTTAPASTAPAKK